jgi:hypothetical protein
VSFVVHDYGVDGKSLIKSPLQLSPLIFDLLSVLCGYS